MERIKTVLIWVVMLTAIAIGMMGCGVKKNYVERVKEKDTISYVLPFKSEISLKALCDTLKVPILDVKSGPVSTRIIYKDGEKVLVTQYDTIYKDKIKYRDREVIKQEVKYKTHWGLVLGFMLAGFVIGFLRPWRWFI